jgi:hypothetical protein
MFSSVCATNGGVGTSIVRFVLGIVFFAHGAQLMLGWFGGYELQGSIQFFSGMLHIPLAFAFLAISAEFLGGWLSSQVSQPGWPQLASPSTCWLRCSWSTGNSDSL